MIKDEMPKLQAKWSVESALALIREFTHPGQPFPEFKYTPELRWYQFWRWHLIYDRDYILSRAAELIHAESMAACMQKELDAIKPMSELTAQVGFMHDDMKPTPLPARHIDSVIWVCEECWDSNSHEVLTLGRLIRDTNNPPPCEWCGKHPSKNAVRISWMENKND